MDCSEYKEKIIEYADGGLEEAERTGFVSHAENCPACAAELAEIEALFASLRGSELADPGELFWKRFNSSIYDKIEIRNKPRAVAGIRGFKKAFAGFAAAALIVITITGFGLLGKHGDRVAGNIDSASEVDIVVATLDSSPAAVPDFTTLYASQTGSKKVSDTAREKKRLDTAVEILDSGFYETSTKAGYGEIPEIVNKLTEEEAQKILEILLGGGASSSSTGTSSNAT